MSKIKSIIAELKSWTKLRNYELIILFAIMTGMITAIVVLLDQNADLVNTLYNKPLFP